MQPIILSVNPTPKEPFSWTDDCDTDTLGRNKRMSKRLLDIRLCEFLPKANFFLNSHFVQYTVKPLLSGHDHFVQYSEVSYLRDSLCIETDGTIISSVFLAGATAIELCLVCGFSSPLYHTKGGCTRISTASPFSTEIFGILYSCSNHWVTNCLALCNVSSRCKLPLSDLSFPRHRRWGGGGIPPSPSPRGGIVLATV